MNEDKVVLTGTLFGDDGKPNSLFSIIETRNGVEEKYGIVLTSMTGNHICEAGGLSSGAVFDWLNDHRDW